MTLHDSELIYLTTEEPEINESDPWLILIVDDEPTVHVATRLVLQDLVFAGAGVKFLNAYSADEAKLVLKKQDGIAVVLLDVVMETPQAGLDFVHYVREEFANHTLRIILRTGHAGELPEQEIMLKYDINDYREKTELTAQKLVTSVIGCIRDFVLLQHVHELNHQLENKVAERTRELQQVNQALEQSLRELEQGQLAAQRVQCSLLPATPESFEPFVFQHWSQPSKIVTGDFVDYFEIDDRYLCCYLADVCGHGVASAFLTVYLKRFVQGLKSAFLASNDETILHPELVLTQLNKALIEEGLGKHIAIFFAVIDKEKDGILFTNAGLFPWPILIDADNKVDFLKVKNTPPGLIEQSQFTSLEMPLGREFCLLVCTDGVLDRLEGSCHKEQIECLVHLGQSHAKNLDGIVENLNIELADNDDICMLMLYRQSSRNAGDGNER